jgi:hypothetical protein
MKYRILCLLVLVPLLSVVFSCSENPIFYNLEREVEIEDGNLNNGISLNNFVRLTKDSVNYYIASGKEIWSRRDTDKNWSKFSNPPGYDKTTSGTTGMVYFNGLIVSAFYEEPGTGNTVLFSISPDTLGTFPVVAGGDWTQIGTPLASTGSEDSDLYYSRYYLFTVNDNLFINKVDYHNYYSDGEKTNIDASTLYYIPSGGPITLTSTLDMPESFDHTLVRDIIYTGSEYWILYNDNVDGVIAAGDPASGTMNTITFDPVMGDEYFFNSIGLVDGMLLLSVSTGGTTNYLYYSDDGSSWDRIKTSHKISCFIDISDIDAPENDGLVLAGCQSYIVSGVTYQSSGYVEIDISSTIPVIQSNSFTDDDNFDSSDLSQTSIKSFFWDPIPADGNLFALTWNKGLWRNSIDGTERSWIWE